MKILHLLSQNELTGAEVYSAELVSEQIKSGHAVYQISNAFYRKTAAKQISLPVETKTLYEFIKSVFQLRKFLKTENIQVIHAHSRAASKLAHLARVGLKIGYVSTIHGRQHISISKKMNNIYGDFLIPVCANISKQLTCEFKYNHRKIKAIENGIDFKKFNFQKSDLRPVYGQSELLKIAVIGRDTGPKKNRTEVFISGFSKTLDSKKIKYRFSVIGGNKNNFKIDNPHVEFINNSVQLNSEIYHKYNLICGSGRVCIEALSSGVPIIAFGEALYGGLVTAENYHELKLSNFGDIGNDFKLPKFNETQATSDLVNFLNIKSIHLENLSNLCSADFNLSVVAKKIQRIYEGAYFSRHVQNWIPILMYHKIPDQELLGPHKIFVVKDNFKKHLQFFKQMGFQTLTFNDLSEFRRGNRDFSMFPKKPLILTFDDGYRDNISNADPLLKKYGFNAQVFLLANPDLDSNTWDQWAENNPMGPISEKHYLISGTERNHWPQSNFVIGSHGINHQKMTEMNFEQKIYELSESKKYLENEFQQPINVFAFTYGLTDLDCAQACEKAGYEYGLNTDTGGLSIEENPYSIFRVNIFPHENFLSLYKKTSKWYRKYYFFKRGI
jgi:peptidoglycan/xylan/chitin deacetylase (PgdA/CDA1 family)/glycosyltransferase involved in cell wall biosynthesis